MLGRMWRMEKVVGVCPGCAVEGQKLDKTIGQPGIAVAICGSLDLHSQLSKAEVGLQFTGSSFRVCRKCAYRAQRAKLVAQEEFPQCIEFSATIIKNGKLSTTLQTPLICGDGTLVQLFTNIVNRTVKLNLNNLLGISQLSYAKFQINDIVYHHHIDHIMSNKTKKCENKCFSDSSNHLNKSHFLNNKRKNNNKKSINHAIIEKVYQYNGSICYDIKYFESEYGIEKCVSEQNLEKSCEFFSILPKKQKNQRICFEDEKFEEQQMLEEFFNQHPKKKNRTNMNSSDNVKMSKIKQKTPQRTIVENYPTTVYSHVNIIEAKNDVMARTLIETKNDVMAHTSSSTSSTKTSSLDLLASIALQT